jgi:hypothetical protein
MVKNLLRKLKAYFEQFKNFFSKKPNCYSLSFNSAITVKTLPKDSVGLTGCDFFYLDSSIGFIEVIDADKDKKIVTFREVCTENTFSIDEDAFNFLFVNTGVKPLKGTEHLAH